MPFCRGPDYADAGLAARVLAVAGAETLGIIRGLSGELSEEGEQPVGRLVAVGADSRRGGPVERPLFDGLVGVLWRGLRVLATPRSR